MCDKVENIEPLEWPEEIDRTIEAQEKLHKQMIEAMELPEEFLVINS